MFEDLIAEMEGSPVIMKGDYAYYISPYSNGTPPMDPAMVGRIAEWMVSAGAGDCDLILAV